MYMFGVCRKQKHGSSNNCRKQKNVDEEGQKRPIKETIFCKDRGKKEHTRTWRKRERRQ